MKQIERLMMMSIHLRELDAWRGGRRYNYSRRKELMASHGWSEAIDLKKHGSRRCTELSGRLFVTTNIKEISMKEVLSPLDALTWWIEFALHVPQRV